MRSIWDTILDNLTWGFLLLFAVPSVMIVTSWNSLPGERLYGVKLAIERTALAFASPSVRAQNELHIKYTERRFSEAKQLLANKSSVEGLAYLDEEIATAKNVILRAPPKQRQELAKQYVATLKNVKAQLVQQKRTTAYRPAQAGYSSGSTQPNNPQQAPIYVGTTNTYIIENKTTIIVVATPTPVPGGSSSGSQAPADDNDSAIDDSIGAIDGAIDDLEDSDSTGPDPLDVPDPTAQPIPTVVPQPTARPMPTAVPPSPTSGSSACISDGFPVTSCGACYNLPGRKVCDPNTQPQPCCWRLDAQGNVIPP